MRGSMGAFHLLRGCVLLLSLAHSLPPAAPETTADYYHTLHVEPTATEQQIKNSFRKLAVKFHPDKNKSEDAERTFREIAEAYKVLSHRETRRQYDLVGHEAFLNDGASADPDDDHEPHFHFYPADFFDDFEYDSDEDETHFHWSFQEDVDHQHTHFSFDEVEFTFYFGDNEEEHF